MVVKPYIGVTGASSVIEVNGILAAFENMRITMDSPFLPMLGVQVSHKSLFTGKSEGNLRVPEMAEVPNILAAVKGKAFSTIHYYTVNVDKIVEEITTLMEYGHIYDKRLVNGLQLNISLPQPSEIDAIKKRYPDIAITIQIDYKNMDKNMIELYSNILSKCYANVDYILLDASLGKGVELNPNVVREAYDSFKNSKSNATIIVAGGIGPQNVEEIATALKAMARGDAFGIDAEGRLRDKVGDGYGNDKLNMQYVNGYLAGAKKVLCNKL